MNNAVFKESIWSIDSDSLGNPDDCIQGHAVFIADRNVQIDIPFGSLLKCEPESGVIIHNVYPLTADAVYGFSQDGFYQTVINVEDFESGLSIPGCSHQTLSGSELYIARELVRPNPRISGFTMEMKGLREWVGLSPFSEKITYEEDYRTVEQFELIFKQEDVPEICLYNDQGCQVFLQHVWSTKGGKYPTAHFTFGYESNYRLMFLFSEPALLNDAFRNWVLPVRNFMSFCMGFRGLVENMAFETSEGIKANYYIALVDGEAPTDGELQRMPITWRGFQSEIPSMLKAWLSLDRQASEAAIRAVALLDKNDVELEVLFLTASQAFEAITRVGVDQFEIEPEKHQARINEIKESNLSAKLKKWVLWKVKHANEKSADELAKNQLSLLGEYASYVAPDLDTYLLEHRDTRNYYTHLDAKGKYNVLGGGLALLANLDVTIMLLYGSICRLLGMDMSRLTSAIRESGFKQSAIRRAREKYRLNSESQEKL